MYQFIEFLRKSLADLASLLHDYHFDIGGLDVSLLELFLGFLAIGFVISVFWKGARA